MRATFSMPRLPKENAMMAPAQSATAPATAAGVAPAILLVPLLAFDEQGWRVGYGGGFYDRTLQVLRTSSVVAAVGIAYDEQHVAEVPHFEYDEPLDWVLTPSGLRRCKR